VIPTIQIAQIPVNWPQFSGFSGLFVHDISKLPGLPPVL